MSDKINQVIHKLLDNRSGKSRITDEKAFDAAFSNETATCEVDGGTYPINDMRLEPVENERGEKAFKATCEAGGSRWEIKINAVALRGLKAEEIKAERETERPRGMSM